MRQSCVLIDRPTVVGAIDSSLSLIELGHIQVRLAGSISTIEDPIEGHALESARGVSVATLCGKASRERVASTSELQAKGQSLSPAGLLVISALRGWWKSLLPALGESVAGLALEPGFVTKENWRVVSNTACISQQLRQSTCDFLACLETSKDASAAAFRLKPSGANGRCSIA